METCGNCEANIADLEPVYIWGAGVICGDCHGRLNRGFARSRQDRPDEPYVNLFVLMWRLSKATLLFLSRSRAKTKALKSAATGLLAALLVLLGSWELGKLIYHYLHPYFPGTTHQDILFVVRAVLTVGVPFVVFFWHFKYVDRMGEATACWHLRHIAEHKSMREWMGENKEITADSCERRILDTLDLQSRFGLDREEALTMAAKYFERYNNGVPK